jgi:UDP-3-O-[3-hydroxymyristoyl] glucosamine N-acyltransferase
VIAAQAHVGAQAVVGAHTRLHPRAMLADACVIGERCTVHGGVVIGADGFGFAPGGPAHGGAYVKIEQLGIVRIGNDVDIGANTCIDRGAIGDTVIGNGVKLDNLIQIAHNVQVGDHTAMAAFVGIAGSAKIGAHCMLGGACRIYGHIQIVDHVFVDTCAVISRSILKAGHYSGYFPFDDNATWEKNAATLRHLYTLRERLRALEKRVK